MIQLWWVQLIKARESVELKFRVRLLRVALFKGSRIWNVSLMAGHKSLTSLTEMHSVQRRRRRRKCKNKMDLTSINVVFVAGAACVSLLARHV